MQISPEIEEFCQARGITDMAVKLEIQKTYNNLTTPAQHPGNGQTFRSFVATLKKPETLEEEDHRILL